MGRRVLAETDEIERCCEFRPLLVLVGIRQAVRVGHAAFKHLAHERLVVDRVFEVEGGQRVGQQSFIVLVQELVDRFHAADILGVIGAFLNVELGRLTF